MYNLSRYLATGESFTSLAFQFRVSYSEVAKIVRVCLASIKHRMLRSEVPELTSEDLRKNAEDFNALWHFPNCCGAIDGKKHSHTVPRQIRCKFL